MTKRRNKVVLGQAAVSFKPVAAPAILSPVQGSYDEIKKARSSLRNRDIRQQIWLRPLVLFLYFILLAAQNIGLWFLVVWALNANQLDKLQLIFATLISGTLIESYWISKFMVSKLFGDIDYSETKKR